MIGGGSAKCPACELVRLRKAEVQRGSSGTFVCSDRACECCMTTTRARCECGCIGVFRDEA